ncbi:general secretion pathway protein GspK [Shewanella sp. UCD-KL12]|uniref:general secretion pathway protein GspK n=1 Tax=Shewanella sp. UCD-KL12 TaxID=1917163 RepID=UPI000970642B|nr:type II secretion system protein GspK [Shewanella sp. UCD-KL12]
MSIYSSNSSYAANSQAINRQKRSHRSKVGLSHCNGTWHAKQKGIALFQVLLITAVISIMAMQFTQTARNQISIASTIVDRVQAQSELRSAEAELLFSLITEKRQRDIHSNNSYAQNWNFYGKPFGLTQASQSDLASNQSAFSTSQPQETYRFNDDGTRLKNFSLEGRDNVQITMQDQTGLISLYRGNGATKFEELLNSFSTNPRIDTYENSYGNYFENSYGNNYESSNQSGFLNRNAHSQQNAYQQEYSAALLEQLQPSIMANSMVDWQDGDDAERINGAEARFYDTPGMPTNLPLQTYQELRHVRGFNRQMLELLWPYITIRPQGYINPMIAPPRVMGLYMPQDRVDEIVRLRETGQLDQQQFENLSGLEVDETINFVNSGLLRIEIQVSVNQVLLTKQLDIMMQPYDKHPYIVYEIKI